MGESADSNEIDRLTKRLAGERELAEESARREEQEREPRDAAIEHAEAERLEAALVGLAELAPMLLRERADEAELIAAPTTRRAGLFRTKVETRLEEIPAWEVGAGTGVVVRTSKEGPFEFKRAYRLMLTADGRLLLGDETLKGAQGPSAPRSYRELDEPSRREALAACGLPTGNHVAARTRHIAKGEYESRVTWVPPGS